MTNPEFLDFLRKNDLDFKYDDTLDDFKIQGFLTKDVWVSITGKRKDFSKNLDILKNIIKEVK